MEQLTKVACYFRWMRSGAPPPSSAPSPSSLPPERNPDAEEDSDEYRSDVGRETSRRLFGILESILLWENSVNSISVIIVFNILFWSIVVLEVRAFAAASSAALVVVLCYNTLEAQASKENKAERAVSHAKTERIEKLCNKIQSTLHNLKQLRNEQPGVFCTAVCSISLGLWILGRAVNGILLAYTICMSLLLGPALLLKVPDKMMSHKEWDSEIEDFLPAVTETNLQVLRRAGESGDHSPTPTSILSERTDEFFNDEDLMGLRMPSHEDGSTDGVELSELELSVGESDGIKFQSGHFEKSSSSEEEAELEPDARKIIGKDDESDSEFEIIDSQEVANLNIS